MVASLVAKGIIRSITPIWNPKIRLYSRDDCRKLLADSVALAGADGCANPPLAQVQAGRQVQAGAGRQDGKERKKRGTRAR